MPDTPRSGPSPADHASASPGPWTRWRRASRAVRVGTGVGVGLLAILLGGALASFWPTGEAAPVTVGVGGASDVFTPAKIDVNVGDTVTFNWQGGSHNVIGVGAEEFSSPTQTSGTFAHTFTKPGTVTFVCAYHPAMVGKITVAAVPTGAPPSAAGPLPGGQPTPAGSATQGAPTGAAGPATGATVAPKLSSLRRVGARLRFRVNAQARVVAVAHGARGRGLTIASELVAAGRERVNLALQRLRVGRYVVSVRARSAAGRSSQVTRLSIRVTSRLRRVASRLRPIDHRVTNPKTAPPAAAPAPAPASPPAAAVAAPSAAAPPPLPARPPIATLTPKQSFQLNCGGCHTLAAAGTTGRVGPDLDDKHPDVDKVVKQVTSGGGGMPAFGDRLTEPQIAEIARYVADAVGRGGK